MIASDTGISGLLAAFSGKPLLGEADSEYIRLRKLNHFRNALQPEFRATLEPYGSGTRLDCCIGLPIPARILLSIAILTFTLVGIVLVVRSITDMVEGRNGGPKAESAFGSLLVPIMLVCMGRYLAHGEKELLEKVVVERLDAQRDGV